jgi:hypothetical protein
VGCLFQSSQMSIVVLVAELLLALTNLGGFLINALVLTQILWTRKGVTVGATLVSRKGTFLLSSVTYHVMRFVNNVIYASYAAGYLHAGLVYAAPESLDIPASACCPFLPFSFSLSARYLPIRTLSYQRFAVAPLLEALGLVALSWWVLIVAVIWVDTAVQARLYRPTCWSGQRADLMLMTMSVASLVMFFVMMQQLYYW